MSTSDLIMRSVQLVDSTGGAASLLEVETSVSEPDSDSVLIQVHAAGVTPGEMSWYPTTHLDTGEPRQNTVPGHEFSGVAVRVGQRVIDVEAGQEVFGMSDWFSDGATAEYCLAQPASIAPKPTSLSHAEAASVPSGALTAWQGLDRVDLQPGEKVLVHGGSGAVGIYAVQLAGHRGAKIVATASASNLEFVAGLGAAEVIDYRSTRFEDVVENVDVVFDTVGGETLDRSWDVLAPEGRMITIASQSAIDETDRVKAAFFIVEPNREQLLAIASLLDDEVIQCLVGATIPLSKAPAAYAGMVDKTDGRGKVVVCPRN